MTHPLQGIFEDSGYLMDDFVENSEMLEDGGSDHRASCHRCGNMRKNVTKCTECPHVFCCRCTDKMISMDGPEVFRGGCPLCKDLCCCGSNKSQECTREFHCYKKCLRYRNSPRSCRTISPKLAGVCTANTTESIRSLPFVQFLKNDSDSENEDYLAKYACPILSEEAQPSSEYSAAKITPNQPESILNSMRSPVTLAPIDTSFVSPSLTRGMLQSLPSNCTPHSAGKRSTPGSKSWRGTPKGQRAIMDLPRYHQQNQSSPQPPFNSGIPSIFAPQSLTPEISPFFLQSSLPSTHKLPSIRYLLQSELANPFARDLLPPKFHHEMENFHIAEARREGLNDPAVGFGFTFGNLSAAGLPQAAHVPTTSLNSQKVTIDSESSVTKTATFNQRNLTENNAVEFSNSAFVSTPNIDRACEYLSRIATQKATSKISAFSPEHQKEKASKISKTFHEHDLVKPLDSTVLPRSAEALSPVSFFRGQNELGSQTSTLPLQSQSSKAFLSPVDGLFCTPLAMESYISQQNTQRSELDGCNGSYDWSGDTAMHFGVDALTPAGLPQCTPMTMDPVPQLLMTPSATIEGVVTPASHLHLSVVKDSRNKSASEVLSSVSHCDSSTKQPVTAPNNSDNVRNDENSRLELREKYDVGLADASTSAFADSSIDANMSEELANLGETSELRATHESKAIVPTGATVRTDASDYAITDLNEFSANASVGSRSSASVQTSISKVSSVEPKQGRTGKVSLKRILEKSNTINIETVQRVTRSQVKQT